MGNSKRLLCVAALCLVAAVALSACGSSGDSSTESSTAAGGGGTTESPPSTGIVVGHVSPHLSNPTLAALNLGQQRAAEELGWKVRTLDAKLSPETQATDLETLVNLKVDAITSWTLDPGTVEGDYQKASEAGIPLVGFNSKSNYINTNVETELSSSCKPFEAEAAYIAEHIPKASVVVVGPPPVPPLEMRQHCFETAAKKEGLSIIEGQNNLSDTPEGAQTLVQSMLTANPDVQAIWAYNDPSALGASAALQAIGKQVWSGESEGVIVIGNNGDSNAIEAIKAGTITLTYDENTFEAGVDAIEALKSVLAEGKPVSSMPKKTWVKSTMYDAANVDEYVLPANREVQVAE